MLDAAHNSVPPPPAYTTSSQSAPSQPTTEHPAPTQPIYTSAPVSTSTSVTLTACTLRNPPPASAPHSTMGPTFEQDPYKWTEHQGDNSDEGDDWDEDDFELRERNCQTR